MTLLAKCLRPLVASANLGLVTGALLLGARAVRGAELDPLAEPGFRAARWEIPAAPPRTPGEGFATVWAELDRPPPVPETPPPPPPAAPARAPLVLLWASVDEADPARSSCIVAGPQGQAALGPGDAFEGRVLVAVDVSGRGAARVAVVTLRTPSGDETLRLERGQ